MSLSRSRVGGVLRSLALLVCMLLGSAEIAHADQFIVTDVMYTHSAATTTDSHYHVKPLAGTPVNWVSPVNYAKGSVHVLLEVKTKPAGGTPTKFQICFESTPAYACTDQSPTYTETGSYEWTTPFSKFYLGGEPPSVGVDWTKGVASVALILKDTMNNKPQGDPKYVPSDLHVQVAVLNDGAKYTPSDAGISQATDAGATDAALPLAIADASTTTDSGASRSQPSTGTPDAGAPSASGQHDASIVGRDSEPPADAGGGRVQQSSGCSAGEAHSGAAWPLSILLVLRPRRRKTQLAS